MPPGEATPVASVVLRRLPGRTDLLTLASALPERYPCLLESVAGGQSGARWDMLLATSGHHLCLRADGTLVRDGAATASTGFLDALDAAWQAERVPPMPHALPFHGGWALFVSYELAAQIEPRLHLPVCVDETPMAMAWRCPAAILYDHRANCTWLVAEDSHADMLDRMQRDLARQRLPLATLPPVVALDEDDPQRFVDAVAAAHEHIVCGNIFQANLSRAWQAHFAIPPQPAALYAALRDANPAPFAGLWQQPGWSIASSSPERLVSVRTGRVETRPIAGTRPRRGDDDDTARKRELVVDPKECAEHIMLVDLERNDLGRVCRPGTIHVDELMAVETYTHVHHLVSTVSGRLRDGVTPGQVIAATFPGGTITGCPKVRCMQIIAELEREGRGVYTGSMGYLDRRGDLDLNILIRSMVLTRHGVRFRAGAGIVADSVASRELEETRAKARGLVRALEAPHGGTRTRQR